MTDKKDAKASPKVDVLEVVCGPDQDPDVQTAKAVLSSAMPSSIVSARWSQSYGGGRLSLMGTVRAIQEAGQKVKAGDMGEVEARLLAQATALDVLFADLTGRAASNVGEYPEAFERYLKLALKAQNQSRMTLETLANVKNPPVVYAKQANINNGGQQQVNNGVPPPAPATENKNQPSKLLEQALEQRMDSGTQGQSVCSNPSLEALVALDRAKVG